ncbi:hypothetical protein BKE38_28885 [Pseudoroseomonas deserti]|uniref:Uncharacterized protein n=1 Tax=Teichococcus deserti TaxID=1817963 RepID=A0A1V2GTI4_9PROT|nr:hypothetical protein [Pseudoroseomonas deserti]ONG43406.1 hypothetical protein BKE38_28885 [Pseudoroseomonas deserti]
MSSPLPKPALVQQFLRRLKLSRSAILPLTLLDPRHAAGQCHVNVAHRVREAGGEVVPGWIVRQGMFNAVAYHAVWQPPGSAGLVDLTPRADGAARIVFLADPARRIAPSAVPGCELRLWADRILGVADMPAVYQGRPSAERVDIAFDAAARHALQQLGLTPQDAVAIGAGA